MRPTLRALLACLLTPVVPVLMLLPPGKTSHIKIAICAYPALLGGWAITYLILEKLGRKNAMAYLGGGVMAGFFAELLVFLGLLIWSVFYVSLAAFFQMETLFSKSIGTILAGGLAFGFLLSPLGFLFWLIARPDHES
jgi:hypothetical protein